MWGELWVFLRGDLCWGRGGGGLGRLVWGGGGVSGGGYFLRGGCWEEGGGRGGRRAHFAVLCVRGSVLVGSSVVWSCSGLSDFLMLGVGGFCLCVRLCCITFCFVSFSVLQLGILPISCVYPG